MGPKKKWHMHSQPKRSRDDAQQNANSDGQQQQQHQPNKRPRVLPMNLGNVKGHQAVVGTCDVRNDRQATAELVDLLNAFADELYPEAEDKESAATGKATPGLEDRASDSNNSTAAAVAPASAVAVAAAAAAGSDNGTTAASSATATSPPLPASSSPTPTPTAAAAAEPEKPPELSVEEMVRLEADALRSGKAKSHRFKSVNTSVRGVVMVCVMDPKVDVLKLVDAVFSGIRSTRQRRCRFLERVTPMQVTAFSEIEAFKFAAESMVYGALPQVAEGVPPLDAVAGAPLKASANAAATAAAASDGKTEASLPTNKAEAEEGQTAVAPTEVVVAEKTLTPAADGAATATEQAPPNCAEGEEGSGGGSGEAAAAAAGGDGSVGGSDEVVAAALKKKTCDKRWKFRVDVRRRNSGLKRLDLINAVADSVGKGHTVSMASPEVTIAIEAVKSVVGVSVLFDYALNHEYSISRLQDAVCGALLND